MEPANYRPVFLTSFPCKLLESAIRDKIMIHLVENKLLNESQHGFVKSKSCITNLLETLDLVTSLLANGDAVDIL